jgi:hypothetical protein
MSSAVPPLFLRRLSVALAVWTGGIVLLHYFWPVGPVREAAQPVLRTVVLLSGMVLVLAAARLVVHHGRRWRQPESAAFLVGAGLSLGTGLLPGGYEAGPGWWVYAWLLRSGWAALLALVPLFLLAALYRRLRMDEPAAFLFVAGLVLMLVAQMPAALAIWPWLAGLRHALLSWLVAPVLRGVLIGLSLGVVWRLLAHLGGRSG